MSFHHFLGGLERLLVEVLTHMDPKREYTQRIALNVDCRVETSHYNKKITVIYLNWSVRLHLPCENPAKKGKFLVNRMSNGNR